MIAFISISSYNFGSSSEQDITKATSNFHYKLSEQEKQEASNRLVEYIKLGTVEPDPEYSSVITYFENYPRELNLIIYHLKQTCLYSRKDHSLLFVLLNSHIDVVPAVEYPAFNETIVKVGNENSKIYNRGSLDNKGLGIIHLARFLEKNVGGVGLALGQDKGLLLMMLRPEVFTPIEGFDAITHDDTNDGAKFISNSALDKIAAYFDQLYKKHKPITMPVFPGATDLKYLRGRGIASLRVLLINLQKDTAHGNDDFLKLS
ncbi:hypothetical protein K502DRAFT_353787 [Neoconidiobolus thromboides FSU 785]|nr:hypothetical protein K502DRAFT_353787 [Neoconidiobolus thromboides FSU 785]